MNVPVPCNSHSVYTWQAKHLALGTTEVVICNNELLDSLYHYLCLYSQIRVLNVIRIQCRLSSLANSIHSDTERVSSCGEHASSDLELCDRIKNAPRKTRACFFGSGGDRNAGFEYHLLQSGLRPKAETRPRGRVSVHGGEDRIRTCDRGFRPGNRLAGGPIRPLWHLPVFGLRLQAGRCATRAK